MNALRYVANGYEIRIKPQPEKFAELKKAHAEGKTIQWKYSYQDEDKWQTVFEPSWLDRYQYRIKPEPVKVPLGPDDVPPGSVLYYKSWGSQDKVAWVSVIQVTESNGILVAETNPQWYSFQDLMCEFEINRSIPLTGKWNPTAWEPCYKEVEKLIQVLWGIALSDHIGDVCRSINPLLDYFGIKVTNLDELIDEMNSMNLIPECYKDVKQ